MGEQIHPSAEERRWLRTAHSRRRAGLRNSVTASPVVPGKVHQAAFDCGCCPPRQERHRSYPKGIHRFRSYYVLDGGEGVGVAVMMFETRESANANDKVLEFVQASLHDLNLGRNHRRRSFGEYKICCVIARKGSATCAFMASRSGRSARQGEKSCSL